MAARWPLLATIALGLACRPDEVSESCGNGQDDDGDGYVDCADQDCFADPTCGEATCDDQVDDDGDGLVDCDDPDCDCTPADCTPPCTEDCTNGADDDRDFLVDCADPDCDATCDADADGWVGLGGPDCDDTRADVNPDADEVPYDGADNDCDPLTPDDDLDGDGFLQADDCDDALATSYPGAPETCGNGVVDDCTVTTSPPADTCYGTRSLATADVRFTSTTAEGWLGSSLASLGDVDADGTPEVVLGMFGDDNASGALLILSVPEQGTVDVGTARAKITGLSEQDWVGESVAVVPRANGDGLNILAGARYEDGSGSNAGAAYVVLGTTEGTTSLTTALSYVSGEAAGDQMGAAVRTLGDVNGDGRSDVAYGAPLGGVNMLGAAYVAFGPVPPGISLVEDAAIRISARSVPSLFGDALAGQGDVDGDGLADLLVGARLAAPDGIEGAGAAYLFTGLTGPLALDDGDAVAILQGTTAQAELGAAVLLADLTGDPRADVVAGAPGIGEVWIATGSAGLLAPTVRLTGPEGFGAALSVGDLDGDGTADLVVGAPDADTDAGEDAGAVYVFFGPVTDGQAPDVTLEGHRAFGFAGQAVAVAPDWTGDGRDELLVGAPYADSGASASGEVGIVTWGF